MDHITVLLCLCVGHLVVATERNMDEQIPHKKGIVVGLDNCTDTYPDLKKDPVILISGLTLYNTTKKINMVKTSFIIKKDTPPNVMITLQGYEWKENKWTLMFSAPKMSCSNFIVMNLAELLKIARFCDIKKCFCRKGQYKVSNVDVDSVLRFGATAVKFQGRMMWRFLASDPYRKLACIQAYVNFL